MCCKPIQCQQCQTITDCHHCLRLIDKQGKIKQTDFCCYKCYLDFWNGTPQFTPLQEELKKQLDFIF